MSIKQSQYGDEFDKILASSLRKYTEPKRPDFTNKMLEKIIIAEQQRRFNIVVLQKRLAMVAFGASFLFIPIVTLFFPQIIVGMSLWLQQLYRIVSQVALVLSLEWQFWPALTVIIGFAIFCCYKLLLTNNWETT